MYRLTNITSQFLVSHQLIAIQVFFFFPKQVKEIIGNSGVNIYM